MSVYYLSITTGNYQQGDFVNSHQGGSGRGKQWERRAQNMSCVSCGRVHGAEATVEVHTCCTTAQLHGVKRSLDHLAGSPRGIASRERRAAQHS